MLKKERKCHFCDGTPKPRLSCFKYTNIFKNVDYILSVCEQHFEVLCNMTYNLDLLSEYIPVYQREYHSIKRLAVILNVIGDINDNSTKQFKQY